MLNIDGVVFGNARTNLAGLDLNRVWSDPSPQLSPVIFATKMLARMIKEERDIKLFCDMHGHFQPIGGFMYCNTYNKGGIVPQSKHVHNASLRIIPYLLSQLNPLFRIRDTTFTMETYKSSSARQVFFTEFGIPNSFTLENSFFKKIKVEDPPTSPLRQSPRQKSPERSKSVTKGEQRNYMTETSRGEYKDSKIIGNEIKDDGNSIDTEHLSADQIQEQYDSKHSCKHFTQADHMKLGSDLGRVLHTALIYT